MTLSPSMRRPGCALLGVILALWLGDPVRAQVAQFGAPVPVTAADNVQQRLDNLETENRALRDELQQQRQDLRKLQDRPAAPTDKTYVVGQETNMTATWRHGLLLETADKAFRMSVGGRVDFDSAWYGSSRAIENSIGRFNGFSDPGQGLADGMDIRRLRLRLHGDAYEVMDFQAEVDFANFIDLRRQTLGITGAQSSALNPPPTSDLEPAAGVQINEAYLGFTKLPYLGTFRAGQHREGLNFATATGGRFLTFMERPLIFEAFNSDFLFADGFTWQQSWLDDRLYVWAALMRNNTRLGGSVGDGEYVYDLRVTGLTWYDEQAQQWVHLGADYSYRNLHLHQTRFRARPEVRNGPGFETPNILNTGTIFSNDGQQIGTLEFASAWGPWTLTAEAEASWLTNSYTGGLPINGVLPKGVVPHGTYFAKGTYVEVLYFLTGDHRSYRKERPGYDRIIPNENFYLVRGPNGPIWGRGAWELGVRYDWLDLTSNGINGGSAHAVTCGLNWHLNPNMKVQWNYLWMRRDFDPSADAGRLSGPLHALGMRFHWDF